MYSFEPKKTSQVHGRIRRILDLTVPNWSPDLERDRAENRSTRVIPALLWPWRDNAPVMDQHSFVLTKDFASEGVGLVLNEPFRDSEALLGFWLGEEIMDEPWFFLGTTQHLRKFGGGYWTLGLHLTEIADSGALTRRAAFAPLLDRLQSDELVAP